MPSSFERATQQLELYVRKNIELDTPDAKGTSKRKHLAFSIKQWKKAGKDTTALETEIQPVRLLPGSVHLLGIFNDLSAARSGGFSGPLPLSFHEIKAYMDLMGEELSAWEVKALRRMDIVLLESNEKQNNKKDKA